MFKRVVLSIKLRSNATLRAWSYQFEGIVAQRSRRIQQLFSFYKRMYGPYRLQQLLYAYRRQFQPPLCGIMLSAVGLIGLNTNDVANMLTNTSNVNTLSNFNWSNERLSLANFDKCRKDIEFIETLSRNKLCDLCKEKQMKYCYCQSGNKPCMAKDGKEKNLQSCNKSLDLEVADMVNGKVLITSNDEAQWEPYFSKDQFNIWRREEKPSMYSYKVYARFDDITASDFLHVQTDLKYRRQWDESATALELIETDETPHSNSHLIYWEMQWPRLFANRDYVYCRRFVTDEDKKLMLVVSRGTSHPRYPVYSNKVRVTDYWSLMVIKPYRTFQEPGVHYILTYYDDPGLAIPQSIKSWVTQKQMPDFLKKMYTATKQYSCKQAIEMQSMHHMKNFNIINDEYTANTDRGSWLSRIMWKQREREMNNSTKER